MEINKSRIRIGLAFILVLLFFSILTLVFWDFVRDAIIIPVYYALWFGNLTLKSFPQEIYLILFVLISFVIGLNTVISAGWRQKSQRRGTENQISTSRYTHWRRLSHNLYTSSITKASFIRESRQLILSMLAFQNGIDIAEVEERIKNQDLRVPNVILTLIQKRRIKDVKPAAQPNDGIIGRLRRRFTNEKVVQNLHPDNSPILEIVAYIEHLLEIENVTN